MNDLKNAKPIGRQTWSRAHLVVRLFFLLLTPAMFLYFGVGFIWHSIYFASFTMVILIWLIFILASPLFGRIGCGWFCFIGTIQDLTSGVSLKRRKWKKRLVNRSTGDGACFFAQLIFLLPFHADTSTPANSS